MAYSDKVLDHYTHPRNVGSLDKNSTEVGTGPGGRAGVRRRDEAADQGEPADEHHRRGEVQDLRLRFGHRFVFARDRVGEGQDGGRSAARSRTPTS